MVQTATEWSRDVLRGVADFANEQGGWDCFIEPHGFWDVLQIPKDWQGHGVIGRLTHASLLRSIAARKIPAVNVSWTRTHSQRYPNVVSDQRACGQMAGQHFVDRGFRDVAFIGAAPHMRYGTFMEEEIRRVVESEGSRLHVFHFSGNSQIVNEHGLRSESYELQRWLLELPKPIGVIAWSAMVGRTVITHCANATIEVPDDLAVLCIEDDALMSALAPVEISSLDQAGRTVGYRAAELLEAMIQGKPAPKEPIEIPPHGVIARRSSDATGFQDDVVTAAIKYIRDHADEPIRISDVEKAVSVSRRVLENRFERHVGRSPADILRRVRIERAAVLLRETDLPMPEIAYRCGFNHAESFIRCFKRTMGHVPSQFRRKKRHDASGS
ncbi:DNA-binding transcriptional regulator [Bremerella cremea]